MNKKCWKVRENNKMIDSSADCLRIAIVAKSGARELWYDPSPAQIKRSNIKTRQIHARYDRIVGKD